MLATRTAAVWSTRGRAYTGRGATLSISDTNSFLQILSGLEQDHVLRRLRPLASASGPVVEIAGRRVILMASNDYLGLATHPALKKAAMAAIEQYGVGAGASRLVSGTLPPHTALEQALARFKETESALLFGSGYLANVGVIPALVNALAPAGSSQRGLVLADRLCHASLIDGCRLSRADLRVFRHRDVDQVEAALKRRSPRRRALIVTDGVFSMDGDLAPLPKLLELADRYEAQLFVDDAHGTGVIGPEGRGTPAHFGIEKRLPFHMGTLGKALGTSGAYLVGTETVVQYLINTARSFIYSTAPPPETSAASVAALELVLAEPSRRERLWQNRGRLASGLQQLGLRLADSASPILPVLIGEAELALRLSARLLQLGVYAPAIRPPTVPPGTSRIRLTVTSEHTEQQIDSVLQAFRTAAMDLCLLT
jgi:8-amino-7-oxononanoate synthase